MLTRSDVAQRVKLRNRTMLPLRGLILLRRHIRLKSLNGRPTYDVTMPRSKMHVQPPDACVRCVLSKRLTTRSRFSRESL
jgi:hypothetical protein